MSPENLLYLGKYVLKVENMCLLTFKLPQYKAIERFLSILMSLNAVYILKIAYHLVSHNVLLSITNSVKYRLPFNLQIFEKNNFFLHTLTVSLV